MKENPEGWEIISLHGNYGSLLKTLSSFVTLVPPGAPDTITIKLRETSSGIVYSITANDKPAPRQPFQPKENQQDNNCIKSGNNYHDVLRRDALHLSN
jgi:hypothetical protein